MSGGVTTNYGFKKPNFNVRPWDSDVNSNFDLIDAVLYTIAQVPNIAGMWKNSTQYMAGQNVLDPNTLVFYQCLVNNVSAATGTFAADRIANPTNWTLTQPQIGSVRFDQAQVLTPGQIIQAISNLGLITGQLGLTASQQDFLRLNVNGATGLRALSADTTLALADIDKDVSVTGTTKITMPASANAWRTGIISNDNLVTGIVTLAVPAGATLDGTVDGTTRLFPYQRARIKQTGITEYRTDWVDRTPIVFKSPDAMLTTGVASLDIPIPVGYRRFRIESDRLRISINGAFLLSRMSDNGAAAIKTGAADYTSGRFGSIGTAAPATTGPANDAYGYYLPLLSSNDNLKGFARYSLLPGDAESPTLLGYAGWANNTPALNLAQLISYYTGATSGPIGRVNLLRITVTSGTFTGDFTVWGEP